MASAQESEDEPSQMSIRFHHGTDQTSANDLLQNGVNHQQAAASNGSGEFWVTGDHLKAIWFALANPNSPPAACFEFDLPESVLLIILQMIPPGAVYHAPNDYELLPPCHALLNQHMANRKVVPIP